MKKILDSICVFLREYGEMKYQFHKKRNFKSWY